MKEIQHKAEQVLGDKRKLYDFDRFDIDYLSTAAKFYKITSQGGMTK